MITLFTVPCEGGYREIVGPLRFLNRLVRDTPILGVRVGHRLYIYDRICKRLGFPPFRVSHYYPGAFG